MVFSFFLWGKSCENTHNLFDVWTTVVIKHEKRIGWNHFTSIPDKLIITHYHLSYQAFLFLPESFRRSSSVLYANCLLVLNVLHNLVSLALSLEILSTHWGSYMYNSKHWIFKHPPSLPCTPPQQKHTYSPFSAHFFCRSLGSILSMYYTDRKREYLQKYALNFRKCALNVWIWSSAQIIYKIHTYYEYFRFPDTF